METFEQVLEQRKTSLHESIVKVMQEVKNIDKGMQVGSGSYGYKGVADKDVKLAIGQAMSENGLTCVPIDIKPVMHVDRWMDGAKQKQSVFTEVLVTYQITHAESGESINIMGYGHGQDAMDKSAGKATTYALKNALLYAFLVPTGAIDDTDKTHSKDIPTPKQASKPSVTDEFIEQYLTALNSGNAKIDKVQFLAKYTVTPEQLKKLS